MVDSRGFTGFFTCTCNEHAYHSNCKNDCNCSLFNTKCPKCGYDGSGVHEKRKGFQTHRKQLNWNNPNKLICGNCSEAFK